MFDTAENEVQVLGQMAGQGGGGRHAQRFGRRAGGVGALRVQFDGKQTGVMPEFGSGGFGSGHDEVLKEMGMRRS